MGLQNYISETEAAVFAGVSTATLSRFVEAGYLKIENDSDGLKLFSKSEISELFGLPDQGKPNLRVVPSNSPETAAREKEAPASQETPGSKWHSHSARFAAFGPDPTGSEKAVSTATILTQPTPRLGSEHSLAVEALEQELLKLKHVVELQEKILDLKDRELVELKDQKNWLRARIERLEEKQDRDQLLLLSETQMIRKLVAIQEERKGPVRLALEWLGFSTNSTTSQNSTIDVSGQ